jgi:tetratricopeptide (TPR) repeat protein
LLPLLEPQINSQKSGARADRAIYSETDYPYHIFGWSALRALRSRKYLYVEAPKRELYDQTSDLKATKNLAASSPAIADTLHVQAETFRKNTSTTGGGAAKLDPEQAAKLSALGYVTGGNHYKTEAVVSGPDPKDRVEAANLFHDALLDGEAHHYQDAIKALQSVVESEPSCAQAYAQLGVSLIRSGDFSKAVPVLRKALELQPDSSLNEYQLGRALVQTGSFQEALPHLEKAAALTPSAEYYFSVATIYVRLSRDQEALKELDRALEVDPNHYRANLLRGAILADYEPTQGLVNLQKAEQINPNASEPHTYMAKAYERLGNAAKAEEERQKAKDLGGHP